MVPYSSCFVQVVTKNFSLKMLNTFICVEKVRLRDYINSVERFKTELIPGVSALYIKINCLF